MQSKKTTILITVLVVGAIAALVVWKTMGNTGLDTNANDAAVKAATQLGPQPGQLDNSPQARQNAAPQTGLRLPPGKGRR